MVRPVSSSTPIGRPGLAKGLVRVAASRSGRRTIRSNRMPLSSAGTAFAVTVATGVFFFSRVTSRQPRASSSAQKPKSQ